MGGVTEKRFDILSREYENEQEELEKQITVLQAGIEDYEAENVKADKFIEIVKRYTDFTELTPKMLNEFIEKVIVHEPDKSSGEREQQVDIYLNFIGMFTVPEEYDGLTDAERAEKKAIEEKRARQRKYFREWNRRDREKKRLLAEQEQNQQTPPQEQNPPQEKSA